MWGGRSWAGSGVTGCAPPSEALCAFYSNSYLANTLLEQANFSVKIRIVTLRRSGTSTSTGRRGVRARGREIEELVVGANLAALRACVPETAVNIRRPTIALVPKLLLSPWVGRNSARSSKGGQQIRRSRLRGRRRQDRRHILRNILSAEGFHFRNWIYVVVRPRHIRPHRRRGSNRRSSGVHLGRRAQSAIGVSLGIL